MADLRKDVAASTPVVKAKHSSAITSPLTLSKGSKGSSLPSSKDSNSLASASAKLAAGTPTSATRRSARGKGQEATTILEKAQRLAEEKDAIGNTSIPVPSSSVFVLLPSVPDSILSQVAVDSGVNLGPSPSVVLDVIRAKELAQAALAEAAAKQLLIEKSKRDAEAVVVPCDVTSAVAHTDHPPPTPETEQVIFDAPICNLIKKRKQSAKPGAPVRVLLRNTPAHQARVPVDLF